MSDVERAAAEIARQAPGFVPRFAVVLGSGLATFAEEVTPQIVIDYGALPGFPSPAVGGHRGKLILGHVEGTPVAVLQGRVHYYERQRVDAMKVPIRALRQIGCEHLVLTNAAGSLRQDMPAGSVMMISDHINFTGMSPLFGETNDRRFVDMTEAYDAGLRRKLQRVADLIGVTLHEGVYIWFAGPSFETPAEIRAAARLGADAVGMSTVPEVVLARHCGMKVLGISTMTNMAAGMGSGPLAHILTLQVAKDAAATGRRLLRAFLAAGPDPD
jgi:purine nucleotide phosphorylase